jgi:ribulose-5-phosphate 4-epimerase/fuculose-1-phosphate aldolase
MTTNAALIRDLVTANHILYDHGVVDAFGHVSVRHDTRPDRFLLARNMAPGSVTSSDILEFLLNGSPVDPQGPRPYLERFIHGEIYAARPDVMAVVHSHSPSIVPFSISAQQRLRAVSHMAGFIGTAAPLFEIRDTGGAGTDLLIRSAELGRALAKSLGASNIVVMRGHGSTVTAPSLPLVVYRAVYAELNARYQSEAMRHGPITALTAEEAAACAASTEGQVHRPWELWTREAAERRRVRGEAAPSTTG